ncbi:uncharacterized protein LOC121404634 [Drosophila obscura]|uniref:uncharacterized protein LOC121404634 n=1 Tax=Drosophila obscura TaxID=7282 RepID=UPI001BB2371C|nr:uncharacterized protein LOC121404634 [Drosophila obscura]
MVYIHNKPRSAQRKHFVRGDGQQQSIGRHNKQTYVCTQCTYGHCVACRPTLPSPPPGRHKWMESPASVMEVPSSEWILLLLLLLLLLMMDSGCCRWLILLAAGFLLGLRRRDMADHAINQYTLHGPEECIELERMMACGFAVGVACLRAHCQAHDSQQAAAGPAACK